jgi:hypothetical protein
LAVALLFSTSQLALALPAIDETTAAKLAQEIDDQLATNLASQPGVTIEGKTAVKPEGSAFSFTLPVLSTLVGADTFKSGVITGTLTPLDDSDYRFTVALPAPFATFTDATGAVARTVSVSSHDIKGVWRPEKNFLPELTATLGEVVLKDAQGSQNFSLKSFASALQNTLDEAGKMSGTADMSAHGFVVSAEGNSFSVADLAVKTAVTGVNYNLLRQKQQELAALRDSGATSGVELQQLPGLMEAVALGSGNANFSAQISDIKASFAGVSPAESAGGFAIAKARITSTSETGSGGLANISFGLSHEGLAIAPAPNPSLAVLVPQTSSFNVSLANLPFVELVKLMAEQAILASGVATTKPATPPPFDIGKKLTDLLGAAKTELRITNTGFKSPGLVGAVTGGLVARPEAARGVIGLLDAKLTGLDELIAKLGQAAQVAPAANGQPQPQPDQAIQGTLMALTMLQMQGQLAQGTPSSRTYKFELAGDGSVKLNGAVLGMVPSLSPPPSAAPQQPAPDINLPPVQ